jgi:gliding motility-associated-like protein
MKQFYTFFFYIVCLYACILLDVRPVQAQGLTVTDASVQRILEQLVGSGVVISNPTLVGNRLQYGRFVNTDTNIPLDSGIVMSTGKVSDIAGTNTVATSGTEVETAFTNPSPDTDTDLGPTSRDACVIEFDIVPIGDELYFKYTFSSEEYPEFVNTTFNDVFKFLITGPNPVTGQPAYNKKNIALIPNTSTEVSINTVNASTNSTYYQANPIGNPTLRYDAYTINLIARIQVVPCQTYRLKLAIADRGDELYDSGVFIQEIYSDVPTFTVSTNSEFEEILEGCTEAEIDISRIETNSAEIFQVSLGGSATVLMDYDVEFNGTDITAFPFNIPFAIGESSKVLTLKPKSDMLPEADETIKLFLLGACSGVEVDSLEFTVLDKESFHPFAHPASGDIVYRCTPTSLIELEAKKADDYDWTTTDGAFTCLDPDCKKIRVETINTESHYTLRLGVGNCTGADAIEKTITIAPTFLTVSPNETICVGQSTQLTAEGRASYSWTPATGLSCTDCPNPIASPAVNTTYTVTGTTANCTESKTVAVTVIQTVGPAINNLANTYCVDDAAFALTATPSGGTFTVNGNPSASFDPAALGEGNHTIEYIIGTGANCSERAERVVAVYLLPVLSFTNLSPEYCKNDAAAALTATPTGGIFKINGNTVTELNPANLAVGNVIVSYEYKNPTTNCDNTISQTVAIKALPALAFLNVADKYCMSDNTNITAQVQITEANGNTSTVNASTFNPAALGVGPHTLNYEYTGVNGCKNTIQKTFQVNPLPVLSFTNLKDAYCQSAQQVALQASPAGGIFTINGNPATAFNPSTFAIGAAPLVVYSFTDSNGCNNTISKSIAVTEVSFTEVARKDTICPSPQTGYLIEALSADQALPGYAYIWEKDGQALTNNTRTLKLSKPEEAGRYVITVQDAETCPFLRLTLDIAVKCEPEFFVPTAFTPNGDNLNDALQILGEDFTDLDFRIYNRWGEIVFKGRTQGEAWDGNWLGKALPAGVYTWTATYVNVLNPEIKLKKQGRISLLR